MPETATDGRCVCGSTDLTVDHATLGRATDDFELFVAATCNDCDRAYEFPVWVNDLGEPVKHV